MDIRISQCMIVKNEEKNICQALSWGKDVMYEQIVIDTGSTDNTIKLAKQLGARVCHFCWTDNFSAAKNFAIEQCSGDWIAFLDADEYMLEKDVKNLPPMIKELDKRKLDGLSTGWQQLDDKGRIFLSGTQVRFFRNDPDIRYQRRIHEQLESVSGRELRLGDAVNELSIFHTGYQTQNLSKKKSERNKKLILEELSSHPQDYEMMGYMGDVYLTDGDKKEAEQWYLKSISYMPPQLRENDQRSAITFTRLLIMLGEKEDSWESIREIYEKAVKALPKESDFDYAIGRILASQGKFAEALNYLEASLEKLNLYGRNNKALLLAGNLLEVYELLVRCCFQAEQTEKCASYATTYLKYDKYGMAVLSKLLKVLIPEDSCFSEKEYQEIQEFLSFIYDFFQLKDRLFLLKTAELSKRSDFSNYIQNHLFTPEERNLLTSF